MVRMIRVLRSLDAIAKRDVATSDRASTNPPEAPDSSKRADPKAKAKRTPRTGEPTG
jgi:hypothetical protein